MDHGHFDHANKVYCQLLESGGDPPAALEPADAALHRVPLTILFSIQLARPATLFILLALCRNDGFDATFATPLTDTSGVIRLVAGDGQRSAATADLQRLKHRFKHRRFMTFTW